MNEKIAVLMSTYNGEQFLRDQIESILNQEKVNVTLYVRDDGSSDRTVEILSSYEEQGKLKLICGKNCGVGNSFMHLLYTSDQDFDFYAFSDQDDIWLPDKLYSALKIIKNQKIPALYTGNQMLVNRKGEKLGLRYKEIPSTDYHQILCKNLVSGCTMVFNEELYTLLKNEKRRPSRALLQNRIHDVWVAMVASITGIVYFDEESHILYRQHERNVVGAREKNIRDRIKEILEKIKSPEQRCGRSKLAREICQCFPEFICDNNSDLKIYGYYKKSLKNKVKLLKEYKIKKISQETQVSFILKILLGLF